MKGTIGYLAAALALLLVGSSCLGLWWLELRIAEAEHAFDTLAFDRSERDLDALERYLEYGSRLPGIGPGPLNERRAMRRASN